MKRIYLWHEMDAAKRCKAIAFLRNVVHAKARYDGTVLPYAWPERIAPLLRHHFTHYGEVYAQTVTAAHHRGGIHSIFEVAPLSIDSLKEAA